MTTPRLYLRLVVRDAPAAIDFYTRALGAAELVRYAEPDGTVVHAELKLGDEVISLTEEDGEANRSPAALGGSAALLTLVVPDADAAGAALQAAGAEVVVPIADQYYGMREGRLRDPFGHLWIVTQHREDLSVDEIQRRVTEDSTGAAAAAADSSGSAGA